MAGEPIADVFSLSPRQLVELAWHDAERGFVDPAGLSDAERAVQAGNGRSLAAIAGSAMSDPTLLARLAAVTAPTLVVWGASDRIALPPMGVRSRRRFRMRGSPGSKVRGTFRISRRRPRRSRFWRSSCRRGGERERQLRPLGGGGFAG